MARLRIGILAGDLVERLRSQRQAVERFAAFQHSHAMSAHRIRRRGEHLFTRSCPVALFKEDPAAAQAVCGPPSMPLRSSFSALLRDARTHLRAWERIGADLSAPNAWTVDLGARRLQPFARSDRERSRLDELVDACRVSV